MATAVALIVSPICRVHLQWVPFRCGVDSNEGTDTVAKEAAALPQARVAADVRTCAAARAACGRGRPLEALNMHQFHAGHWSGSGHNNISAGSERTPPRSASSAQTIPALRAGVSRVVRRKAPSVASFFGARPLGELRSSYTTRTKCAISDAFVRYCATAWSETNVQLIGNTRTEPH